MLIQSRFEIIEGIVFAVKIISHEFVLIIIKTTPISQFSRYIITFIYYLKQKDIYCKLIDMFVDNMAVLLLLTKSDEYKGFWL